MIVHVHLTHGTHNNNIRYITSVIIMEGENNATKIGDHAGKSVICRI